MKRRGFGAAGGGGDRTPRRTAAELDALLDGGTSGDPRLDELLSAARGPARAPELAVPAPAVGVATDPLADGPSTSRRVLTRLGAATLVTKAVTLVAGAAVVGAAAVAGATHHLPGQTRPRPAVAPSPTSGSSSHRPGSDAPSTGAPTTTGASSSAASSATTSPGGSPSASGAAAIPALCLAWLALPPGSDVARRSPRFVVLVRAAGSVPAVTAYCRQLPAPTAGGTATGSRSPSGSRTPSPTGTPSSTPRRLPTPTPTPTPGARSTGR